jgi:metal-dependent hydrolase (beta-lactamase superfamily II)
METHTHNSIILDTEEKSSNFLENMKLFFNHFDDFLDICLALDYEDGFSNIREMKMEIKLKAHNKEITMEEYHNKEAEIFFVYLKQIGVVS